MIMKLRDISDDQVNLTIQYMNDIATYLRLNSPKRRSSVVITQNSLTLPSRSSAKNRRNRLSLTMTDPQEVRK